MVLAIIYALPLLILHYNYYEQAKGLTIKEHEDCLEVFKGQKLISKIVKTDATELHLYMSANMVKYNFPSGSLPTQEYCYAEIKTTEDTVVLNNLIYQDIKYLPNRFPRLKPTYHKSGFAII